ncbi:MAG: DUF2752 domain-containing protein [candidate division KSB1 bacterium]|nr:DUF2752 domain-containing protein [candidate division KSB1 bacterium]MDZ7318001.1 DUF2752 domain-containing protein [candidate division KSB1 bacterium]MDZ7341570.1 DUF2752 domain-containing protein [candidate division KSB1 bacterium]
MMVRWQWQKAGMNQLAGRVLLLSGLATIFLLSIVWNPAQTNILPCYFHQFTGHSCPTCGLSRAFYAISHGHWQQALQWHPLGLVVYFGLLLLLLKVGIEIIWRKKIQVILSIRTKAVVVAGLICIWFAFWVQRILGE